MMQSLTLKAFSAAINGQLFCPANHARLTVSQIVTDSRTFFKTNNSVFFALKGPTNNGHNYISQLREKGMQVFVVSEKKVIDNDAAFILVKDTTEALQKLAAFNRSGFSRPVIGITGSNGKTIIKEWLHDLLSHQYKVIRSPKSYNSQVGVPLSVLLLEKEYDLGIFEAGISQPGEMKYLAPIISPQIGILSNIGYAHQENFESLKQKLNEKLLLFSESEKLVYSVDDELINAEAGAFCASRSVEKINWSLTGGEALIRFSKTTEKRITRIHAKVKDREYTFNIPFTDASALENACHCFACLIALDIPIVSLCPRFEQLQPVAMRLEIKQGANHCLLINDYYNSDLNSFTIALSVLKQQAAKEHPYKVVILSDIQQSGIPAPKLYQEVNQLLEKWGIDKLIGIGPSLSQQADKFTIETEFYPNRLDFERHFYRKKFKASAILIKGARQFEFEKISGLLQQKAHQTKLEINLNALVHNLNAFRNKLDPATKVMVMVKAFSYGSGDVEIASLLQYQNVDYLAVAVADEGVHLRNSGITTPIVVMNPEQDSFQNIIDYKLEPNIYSHQLLKSFIKAVSVNGIQHFPVHLKLDTGMNRLGLKSDDEIEAVIQSIQAADTLKVQSVFSHLAGSDEPALDRFTRAQFERFEDCAELITRAFPYKIDRHILNSAGIERFPDRQYDMVRLGIGLYGITQTGMQLENIGTLKSTISQVKNVDTNETIGYNRRGKVTRESKIAVVPMGYADGLDRKLGNGTGCAFINNKRVPIVGNICMDMLMIDVSGVDAKPGDTVEFFGPNIGINELAEKIGTIPYEILTGISQRVKRVYIQE